MRSGVKEWFCTDGYFDTDADLAEHLAGLVDAGTQPISFWRFDCIFSLRWTDVPGLEQLPGGKLGPHPVAMARRFTVTIQGAVHGSTTAAMFLELWPDGFSSVHQHPVRKDTFRSWCDDWLATLANEASVGLRARREFL